MQQPVGWDLGAGWHLGVPGGKGLCARAQGWQPCPRPLTQHRHWQCGAGNSRCCQHAGSCQARLPDPHRLRGRTVAVPCSVWGQAGQIPSTALAGAVAPLLGDTRGMGLAVAIRLTPGEVGTACPCSWGPHMLLETRSGWGAIPAASQQCPVPGLCVPSTGPSCRAQTTRTRCSACTLPHLMCLGATNTLAQGTRTLKWNGGTTTPLGPCRVGALMPAGLHSPRSALRPPPARSHPPCAPWPAGNQ